MKNTPGSNEKIHEALSKDSIDDLRDYYDKWAPEYDDDVNTEDYSGPKTLVSLLAEFIGPKDFFGTSGCNLLDAACGTGLVGRELKTQNFSGEIYGCDLSESMSAIAKSTGAYNDVVSQGFDKAVGFSD